MSGTTAISPMVTARLAGGCYCITVAGSIYSFAIAPGTGPGHAAGLIAGTANLAVTLLLYNLLSPISASLALLAVFFNLEGGAHDHDQLAFFGCFCVCTGVLVYRSTFLPRIIGGAMVLAGLGLLINAYAPLLAPRLAPRLTPVGFTLDGLGEIPLALWLACVGVDAERWYAVKAGSRPLAG